MKHEPIAPNTAERVEANRPKPVRAGKFILVLIVVAVGLAVSGVFTRRHDDERLAKWTQAQAVPTVALTSLQLDTQMKTVMLPGDVEPFYSASIHGQVSGYVKSWSEDIGATVKRGETLAVVETPELDNQVVGAQGEVEKAEANLALARTTASRWKTLSGSAAVSQQAVDEKVSDERAKQAEVDAAKANLSRLQSLKSFADIVAPFDGAVTQRNVDIGSYVNSSSNGALPQFVVADVHEMRVYVRAPEVYAAALKNGMTAKLRLPEYPDREFVAKIDTTARAIDPKSRSLLVELLADNKDGALRPGSFAQVAFQIPPDRNAMRLSASALLFQGQGPEVAVLTPDNKVKLEHVRIARDYGAEVEIDGGLPANARIVTSPPESITEGELVRVAGEDDNAGKSVASSAGGPSQGK